MIKRELIESVIAGNPDSLHVLAGPIHVYLPGRTGGKDRHVL